jgi:phosphate transport system permease protein
MTPSPSTSTSPQQKPGSLFSPQLSRRYTLDNVFKGLSWLSVALSLAVLLALLVDVCTDGAGRLSWQFVTSLPSRRAVSAGVLPALVGSIWLLFITAFASIPVGLGAGIYLEEFAPRNWFTNLIEINISNLAAVPSIIYGLLGLQVFVYWLNPITGGRSLLAGGLTLALLVLPIIIVTTRESLRAVPNSLRMAGFALGSTRWQVVREHVLPQALPGILTGTILALSRAIGETAPLITIGAVAFITSLPSVSLDGFQSKFSALPIQIYNWVGRPQPAFHTNAAAGIIVLMILLLSMNATAIFLRNRFQKSRL